MAKKAINFGDTPIEKHKLHQYKSPFLIDNIDTNKIIVSNKASFGKKGFKYFIANKISKIYHISKMMNCQKNTIKFWKKSEIVSKKNLIVNLYTMKNV